MMMRMKLAKIIVAAVAVATVIPACSPKKEVDPETFKQSYNQVVMNLARRNYNRALELADSCLNLISKDTSQYYIGLQNAVGMACMELRDSIRSKNAFEASLKMVEKRMRLTDTINYRDVFMKANTMAYLGKKAEALQYIEQYTFPEYELRRFFGRQPADFIKSFGFFFGDLVKFFDFRIGTVRPACLSQNAGPPYQSPTERKSFELSERTPTGDSGIPEHEEGQYNPQNTG